MGLQLENLEMLVFDSKIISLSFYSCLCINLSKVKAQHGQEDGGGEHFEEENIFSFSIFCIILG